MTRMENNKKLLFVGLGMALFGLYRSLSKRGNVLKRREKCMVKMEGLERPEKITILDRACAGMYIGWCYRYDGILLDESRLKVGLERLLRFFPVCGGRFRGDQLEIVFEQDNNGIEFEVVEYEAFIEGDACLPDGDSLNEDWIRKDVALPIQIGKDMVPKKDEALVKIRLTKFHRENVSFLAVSFNHSIGDAASCVIFMDHWKEMCSKQVSIEKQWGLRPVQPRKPCINKKEIEERWVESVNPFLVPFITEKSLFEKIRSTLSHLLQFSDGHQPVEYQIKKAEVEKVKESMKNTFLGPKEWVSEYEVVVGSLMHAYIQSGLYAELKNLLVITNFRAPRIEEFGKDRLGNLVGGLLLHTSHVKTTTVFETIKCFHDILRETLAKNPESCVELSDLLTNAEALNCPMDILDDGLYHENLIECNSWRNYSWFPSAEMEGVQPTSMGLGMPKEAISNLWLQMPKSSNGDGMIYLAVPKSKPDLFDHISFLVRK